MAIPFWRLVISWLDPEYPRTVLPGQEEALARALRAAVG